MVEITDEALAKLKAACERYPGSRETVVAKPLIARIEADAGRIEALSEELAEVYAGIVRSQGHSCGGEMIGWFDSMASKSVCLAGDWLVGRGLWERSPVGLGRSQFYRPIG